MNIIYFLIVFLILVVTAILLNEEIRVSKVLNNIITRGLIILGVVYACMLKDFTLAILLSILFVVLSNDHLETEKFDAGIEETETEMKIDITDSTNKQKCLAKCVISLDDDNTSKCMEFCDNSCFVKCTSNYKNSTFFECQDMCE